MKKSRTILITGGTGLLGKGFIETANAEDKIVSLHLRDYSLSGPGASHLRMDLCDKKEIEKLFETHDFDAVIHAAGIASVDFVENNYAESLESNLVGTLNITSACRRKKIYFVYISTNAVFDGKNAPYAESAPVNPVNKYGQIKVECERLVMETLKQFSIVRPILMYGQHHPAGRPNPVTWILDKLLKNEPVQLVNDVFENPLYNLQCGRGLWKIIEKMPSGVFHFAGADTFNRHALGLQVAKAHGLDASLVHAVDSSYFPSIAPRPKNTSFITTRMERELGITPVRFEDGLADMKRRKS